MPILISYEIWERTFQILFHSFHLEFAKDRSLCWPACGYLCYALKYFPPTVTRKFYKHKPNWLFSINADELLPLTDKLLHLCHLACSAVAHVTINAQTSCRHTTHNGFINKHIQSFLLFSNITDLTREPFNTRKCLASWHNIKTN